MTLLPVGNNPVRLGALETGRVVATPLNPPASVMAQKKGLNVLVDISALGIPGRIPERLRRANTLESTPRPWRFVRSYVKRSTASRRIRETGMKILAKYFQGLQDRDILVKTYELSFSEAVMPRNNTRLSTALKQLSTMWRKPTLELEGEAGRFC